MQKMDEEFYQHIIKGSDKIVAELGCKTADEALAKLGVKKKNTNEIYDDIIRESDAIVKKLGCKTADEALGILGNKKKK